jgi:acyl carrier protein
MAMIPPSTQRTPATARHFSTIGIRTLISKHLDINIERVTDDAHLVDDLGADWLDCLELMIVIEEQFGFEITDDNAGHIKLVGDLIRYIETRVRSDQIPP